MSTWVHCDNDCGETVPSDADEIQSHWLSLTWHGVKQDACSAACAVELVERQRDEDAALALELNDEDSTGGGQDG